MARGQAFAGNIVSWVVVLAVTLFLLLVPLAGAQISEGEVEVVNVRETDPTLGPLVATLIGLGSAALVATLGFWYFTRPSAKTAPNEGRTNG